MTSPAIDAGLQLQMAIYAALHSMNGPLADSGHLFHLSMTSHTRHLCRNVPLMAEVNKVWQIIDFNPGDSLSLFPVTNKLLDLRIVFADVLVASHTKLHGWHACNDRPARVNMAVEAIDFVVARMKLVTEVDWLHGCGLAGASGEDGNEYR
jgi:hypothetical protein